MATRHLPVYPVAFLLSVLALIVAEYWIVSLPEFTKHGAVVALAVMIDVTVGIPLLGYVLLVRPRLLPPVSLAPLLIVSVGVARLLLPSEQEHYLRPIEAVLGLVELVLFSFVIIKVRSIVRAYRDVRPQSVYATDALSDGLRRVLGDSPALEFIVTELSLLYFAVGGWRAAYRAPTGRYAAFTYHVRTGYGILLGALLGLALVELFLVHLQVQIWSTTAAWVLSGLTAYSMFWLLGDFNAIHLHPIIVGPDLLHLRTGMRWRATVPFSTIRLLRPATAADLESRRTANLSVSGTFDFVLELGEIVTVQGLFGMKKLSDRIGICVDDAAAFTAALADRGVRVLT